MSTSRPLISVIVGTARDSYGSLMEREQQHYMLDTFNSLAAQTSQDFEVIIVDSLYTLRDLAAEIASLGTWTFTWRVVHPVSFWLDQGMWALQNAFNVGAVASRGRYLLFCGDCFVFPPDAFARALALLDRGLDPHFLCFKRIRGFLMKQWEPYPTPIAGDYTTIEALEADGKYTPGIAYGDTRFSDPMLQANGVILPQHASWQWFYGYGFIHRADFFSVNGWSELYDGEKSLGDVEMGSRLEQCGRLRFYMERTLVVYEEQHMPICQKIFKDLLKVGIRSNYDLIWLHRMYSITRAHTVRFSSSDLWRCVRALITGLHCWPHRSGYPGERIRDLTEHWIANQPIFTLYDQCAGI